MECVSGGGGGGVGGVFFVVSFNLDLSTQFLFFFYFPFFFFFLGDGLMLDGSSQRGFNPKQQTYQPFRGINSKITKSGRIWNICNLKMFLPRDVKFVFTCFIL